MYRILFHPKAREEFIRLEGRQKQLVIKKINQIAKNPYLGEDLGNKAGIDLVGFRKIYLDKKKLRIVYRIEEEKILIEIIALGKRDKLAVYKNAKLRILDH